MDKNTNLQMKVTNYKAVESADIVVDGITVLTGENGSGKSTLSQLMYFGLRSILDFEASQYANLYREWNDILRNLYRLSEELNIDLDRSQYLESIGSDSEQYEDKNRRFKEMYSFYRHQYKMRNDRRHFTYQELQRIKTVLERSVEEILIKSSDFRFEDIFDAVDQHFDKVESEVFYAIKTRPYRKWQELLYSAQRGEHPEVFFWENGTLLTDKAEEKVNNLYTIDTVFYTDSPIPIFQSRNSLSQLQMNYSRHLQRAIESHEKKSLHNGASEVHQTINKIIGGQVGKEKSTFALDYKYFYRRESDGLNIELNDSATGIKQFAVLQLLLDEGLLNNRTLLILDEPEAHLHPQWVVEYARVLLLLNKKLNVKFMIATHSPDFVNALRSIAEKEEQLSRLNFYLSSKQDHSEQYRLENLEQNIEPVFESFNIALDRINEYGI